MARADDGDDDLPRGLIDYPNVPATVGMAISGHPELLGALGSTLSLEDLHDILEVRRVDGHNARLIRAHFAKDR